MTFRFEDGDGLRLHYQPIFDLTTGTVTGVEALVRRVLPDGTLSPPSSFIPAAEASGSIVALGRWVTEEAMRQLAAWDADPPSPELMGINLSVVQLADPTFTVHVAYCLDRYALDPRRIQFEITETVAISPGTLETATLDSLKRLGVRLALDDFGTGFSSLAHLRHLPVDALKIDRSFTGDLATDSRSSSIVASLIGLAHAVGLRTVAEGVEDADQLAALRELDCDEAQGYHLGVPLEAALVPATLGAGVSDPL